jgi:hypothetical protein
MTEPKVDFDALTKEIETRHSDLWKRLYTKNISAPNGYRSSKQLAVLNAVTVMRLKHDTINGVEEKFDNVSKFALLGTQGKYNFPLYYVAAPLLQALKQTYPPASLKWEGIKMPFSGLTFALPSGGLLDTDGSSIMFVGAAQIKPDTEFLIPGVFNVKSLPFAADKIVIFWSSGQCVFYQTLIAEASSPMAITENLLTDWEQRDKEEDFDGEMPAADITAQVSRIVANLLLIMHASPELVDKGLSIGHRHVGDTTVPRQNPTFVGKAYAVKYESRNETNAHFTELGWRRGHFRQQPFGPGRQEVKTIFIEPFIAHVRGLKCSADEQEKK